MNQLADSCDEHIGTPTGERRGFKLGRGAAAVANEEAKFSLVVFRTTHDTNSKPLAEFGSCVDTHDNNLKATIMRCTPSSST